MARPIVVSLGGETSSFSFSKVERKRLYVSRRRIALDSAGEACGRAALTRDGRFMLRPGMTAQGYFTEAGYSVSSRELVGIAEDGTPLEKQKSTLGNAVDAEQVTAAALLDLRVATVYALDAEAVDDTLSAALDRGELFRFPFRYRDGFDADTAVLVRNDEGTFALIGRPMEPEWVEPAVMATVVDDDDDLDDDLDFDMF